MDDPRTPEHTDAHTPLDPAIGGQVDALLAHLGHTGDLIDQPVPVSGIDRPIMVLQPASTAVLLDQVADDPEQNLPYWSELWPSGIALAGEIARHPDMVRGQRVLELGCGLGLTAAVALASGARLVATDYATESLLFTRITCLRHTGREPETWQVNWRTSESILPFMPDPGFPVVLAADVLYERRDIEPILNLLDRIIAPGGTFWLAEPGRPPAAHFIERAAERGWSGPALTAHGPWPDPKDADVTVRIHQLQRREPISPHREAPEY